MSNETTIMPCMKPKLVSTLLALIFFATKSFAGTITVNTPAEVPDISDFTITTTVVFDPTTSMSTNDSLFITLTNGATFQSTIDNSDLVVTGTGAFNLVTGVTVGASSLEFKATSAAAGTDIFTLTLSGVQITGGSGIVQIDANADDTFGTFDFYTAANLASQTAVPEPASAAAAMGLLSLGGVMFNRRRRRPRVE